VEIAMYSRLLVTVSATLVAAVLPGCSRPASTTENSRIAQANRVIYSPVPDFADETIINDTFPSTVEELRGLMNGEEFTLAEDLAKQGERLFPIYLKLLEENSGDSHHISCTFYVISLVCTDRSRFLPITRTLLVSKNAGTRRDALDFLPLVGNESDSASLAALLYDDDYTVRYAAASALAAIGGRNDLLVFDLVKRHADRYLDRDGKLLFFKTDMAHFNACRDKLEARLKKQEKEKPGEKKDEPKK
jgi:hypothetical protein